MLIDFGSTGQPDSFGSDLMVDIAKDIRDRTGGKLHAVIATHRHKDHISGFSTDGKAPGLIIAECNPDVVVQPWTEDPKARTDAKKPTKMQAFTNSLTAMHAVAEAALAQIDSLKRHISPHVARELAFIGEDNLRNLSAVKNLQTNGCQTHLCPHRQHCRSGNRFARRCGARPWPSHS